MAEGKYLNPKADLTFKKIFGEHEDLVDVLLSRQTGYVELPKFKPQTIKERKMALGILEKSAYNESELYASMPTIATGTT